MLVYYAACAGNFCCVIAHCLGGDEIEKNEVGGACIAYG
jgi:hypothetical protein